MLYLEEPRMVDAEQVNLAAGELPSEVIAWGPGVRAMDGSIGYVSIGPREFANVRDKDWIVRPLAGGKLAVYSPEEFLKRHVNWLERVGHGEYV